MNAKEAVTDPRGSLGQLTPQTFVDPRWMSSVWHRKIPFRRLLLGSWHAD